MYCSELKLQLGFSVKIFISSQFKISLAGPHHFDAALTLHNDASPVLAPFPLSYKGYSEKF
jgi:hypothetical protein